MAKKPKQSGILVAETRVMYNDQREEEQQGHRRFARVNANERLDEEPKHAAAEGEFQNDIPQHPDLNTPQYDGIDDLNVNPIPALNTEARKKYDELQLQKQLKYQLEHGLRPNTAPTPRRE